MSFLNIFKSYRSSGSSAPLRWSDKLNLNLFFSAKIDQAKITPQQKLKLKLYKRVFGSPCLLPVVLSREVEKQHGKFQL